MTATINQCLAQLKTDFEAAFVTGSGGDGTVNAVLDYRTFPNLLDVTLSLSFQGQDPEGGNVTAGSFPFYDILILAGVQIDIDESGIPTETELRTADQSLNTLENAIYTLLGKGGTSYRNSYWLRVSFPQPSTRPPQFVDAPETRIGRIPIRLHLK